ncbi:MAG: transposase, partial [Bacilli bacterium]|nr:transposase [Bacilli bacterium]
MNYYLKKCDETRDIDERRELYLYASLMKGYYKIFLANRYRLEASYYSEETKKEVFGKYLTRQDIIETVINSDEELENAYWLLQDFYKISVYSSYESFIEDINEWFEKVYKYNIPEFKKVMNTYKVWLKEIRNSFIIDN